jgi:putative Mg2+ transporter-C (MgtC) family protein
MASCGYLLVLGANPDVAAQSRVLQGLITGIGFLGGGAILKEGMTVRGMATAASVWNACVIGAAVALDRYGIAVVLTLLNLFTLRALLPLKMKLDGPKNQGAGGL